mmetsp:Transcript_53870/g.155584  ORF Transcript_53870/g.155584 Transcript_53870/m.155584 type:complete len:226 (+) Transcript_53870:139-816(+)
MVNMKPSANFRFNARELPMAVSRPSPMMAILSDKMSASSMKCVDNNVVRPALRPASSRQMSRRDVASTPAVGSSSVTTLEPPAKAMQIDSFRFIPPLSARLEARRFSTKPTSWSKQSISVSSRSRGTDFKQQKSRKCSSTVAFSWSASCCKHTPSCVRTVCESFAIDTPLTNTSPDVGGYKPVRIAIVVDLPAPLWPKRPTIEPSCMSNEMPRSAFFPLLKFLES